MVKSLLLNYPFTAISFSARNIFLILTPYILFLLFYISLHIPSLPQKFFKWSVRLGQFALKQAAPTREK